MTATATLALRTWPDELGFTSSGARKDVPLSTPTPVHKKQTQAKRTNPYSSTDLLAQHAEGEGYSTHVREEAKVELHCLLHHLSFSIQTTLLEILAPVVLQRLAVIQRALPAIIPLLVGCLHALAVYAESCCAPKLFPCVGSDSFANGLLP